MVVVVEVIWVWRLSRPDRLPHSIVGSSWLSLRRARRSASGSAGWQTSADSTQRDRRPAGRIANYRVMTARSGALEPIVSPSLAVPTAPRVSSAADRGERSRSSGGQRTRTTWPRTTMMSFDRRSPGAVRTRAPIGVEHRR